MEKLFGFHRTQLSNGQHYNQNNSQLNLVNALELNLHIGITNVPKFPKNLLVLMGVLKPCVQRGATPGTFTPIDMRGYFFGI